MRRGRGESRHRTNNDGSENRCFTLQVIDEDFRDYTADVCDHAISGASVYRHDYERPGKGMVYSVRVGLVGEWFETVTGKRTMIPNFVYQSDATIKRFIEGLMDSEGWVTDTTHLKNGYIYLQIGVALVSDLAAEFKRMFEKVGIRCGAKTHTKKLPSGKVARQIHINSSDWLASDLTFHCWRKQRKVEAHREARKTLEIVKRMDRSSFNDHKRALIEQLSAA